MTRLLWYPHGGNGVSFLNEKVDYDYNDYDSVGLMNLNIIAAVQANHNPYGGKPTSFCWWRWTDSRRYCYDTVKMWCTDLLHNNTLIVSNVE